MNRFAAAALLALATTAPAFAEGTPAPAEARVYFVNLEDGASVQSPVLVQFGLSGMGVAPAGTERDNTGHHHLLVNRAPFGEGDGDADMKLYGVAADDNHLHFGGGQTETTLELPAGTHTLQLVLGDLNHAPHDPVVQSEQITITVTE